MIIITTHDYDDNVQLSIIILYEIIINKSI